MKTPYVHRPHRSPRAFSLIELSVVIAILLTLVTAGAQLLGHTEVQTRRAGTELISNLIEQARNTAITSRRHVVLAIAEPGDIPNTDARCRLGIFKVDSWPDALDGKIISADQKGRWRAFETGLAVSAGKLEGFDNPLDAEELTLEYESNSKTKNAKIHAIAFNPRGAIVHPSSAQPIVLRVAAGHYRNGKFVPRKNTNNGAMVEQKIRIGRITARPYRINE